VSRVLVTGGAGFIGSALARRLHGDGHDVVVFDDFSRGVRARLPGVEIFDGDIRDRLAVAAAMQGCQVVFHLAYVQGTQTFYSEPRLVVDVALNGIMNVLDACEKQGGKTLVLVSSSEAYQIPPAGMVPTDETVPLSVPDVTNPRYSYGGGKIASELAVLAYAKSGVLDRTVIVRPHNIYGPDMGREHVIPEFCLRMNKIRAEMGAQVPFPIQGTGQETRSFCHIDDAVDGLMVLLDRGADQTVYHLGTMEEVTIGWLARLIGHRYFWEVKVQPGTLPKGSPPRRLPDIGRLQALGYSPKVSLVEGLAETVRWYQNAE
jgi:dTDP-glucose 4,6-dehydratase/UDP-glucose 4-epimerase